MKKTTSILATVLAFGLLTACQRNSTTPNRSGTDAATIASGGNQTPDRTGQQPVSPDRAPANAAANSPAIGAPVVTSTNTPTPVIDSHQTPMTQDTTSRNVTKGAAPNTTQGAWNNSTQVVNQPIPSSTQNTQTTSANRNGVNDSPNAGPRRDASMASGSQTGSSGQAMGMTSNSSQISEISRQIDEVDAEMRNNLTAKQKTDLNKKRQRLVKRLNKLQDTNKNNTTRAEGQ